MARQTFGGRLAAGFALTVTFTVLMAAAAVGALVVVVAAKDATVAAAAGRLGAVQQLATAAEARISDNRAYLLTGDRTYLDSSLAARQRFVALAADLRGGLSTAAEQTLLTTVTDAEARYNAALAEVAQRRARLTDLRDVGQLQGANVRPLREAMQSGIAALTTRVRADVEAARRASSRRATRAMVVVVLLGVATIASAGLVARKLSRRLRSEVGSAVGHIRSSTAQLEAAAAQQVAGGRDQASAMNEITTTISELLITSRQIAESAGRVSAIAEETATAARGGDATIDDTRDSIAAIRTQVDQIVAHMLALGEKSQQIGGVVDLVSELAEQTNILAINATIEASGAGEWGRRFAVVAEEIRKLADRTAGSAKEIRALVEDVRGAVNTTVMATEIGAKAVDAGARQFDAATDSFRQIVELVATTNDATREIELSTKQQTTAVEQVNTAAADTARVTRETEASAVQTRQTATHLSSLSGELLDLVGSGGR